ncbi:MAG: hypothetical protein NC342_08915 [Pseudoflavonifractor sp.]|nr:hypothetical protein [Pseudoflavonifractor sp.]
MDKYVFTVTIDGQEWPAAMTNGALLRFAELRGHDLGTLGSDSAMADNVAIIYACVVSGCRRQGKEFPYSMMEMADMTTPQELAAFARALQGVGNEDTQPKEGKKKTSRQ